VKPRMHAPLWLKLSLAGLLIQALMLGLLVYGNLHLTEDELISKTRLRVDSAIPLLNAALATPLMQRDYNGLIEILSEARGNDAYVYLALLDLEGRRIASSGIAEEQSLPQPDDRLGLNRDGVYDIETPIRLAGTEYGRLRLGISTAFLAEARQRVLRQGIYAGLGAIVLTFLTLTLIGYLLTRRLQQLTQASHALAEQDFDARLPASGPDEVGQLVDAFSAMSHQLKARLSELRDSEQRFFAIANYTYDLELWIEPTGRTIWVNPSVERMTGYDPDECLTLPDFPLCLIDQDDRAEAEQHFQFALRGATGEGYQFRMLRKDGSRFWAAVNWHSIYSRENQFLGIRASIRDISDEPGHPVHRHRSSRHLPQPCVQPDLAAFRQYRPDRPACRHPVRSQPLRAGTTGGVSALRGRSAKPADRCRQP
jgi:PAS domain S-box-containing protein